MSKPIQVEVEAPHIAFLPSGMSQLTPFLRLALLLSSRDCMVTFISLQPSALEINHTFFSKDPEIKCLEFKIHPSIDPDSFIGDPFINRFEAINHSLQHLGPFLSSLPRPVSAIFSDFVVAAGLSQVTADLGIAHYVVSTTSARFFSTVAYLPVLMTETASKIDGGSGELQIPGLAPLPKSSIPPPWLDNSPSNRLLNTYLIPNARSLPKVKGVLINTFTWFEQETIAALNEGRVLSNLPPVIPVGPFVTYNLQKDSRISWLDGQPAASVVYINFGSREAMSTDQIRELGNGLEMSKYTFLWVVKANKVDKSDEEELQELLGASFLKRTENKGRITNGLVNQEEILAHPSIGGFVNQCEWDSVMEAAWHGVPMLAWPQHGDQKMNAEVVEKIKLGMWPNGWGWRGERLVKGEEIGEVVKQVMEDLNIRYGAKKVREEAMKSCGVGGSSEKGLREVIEMLKGKDVGTH